MFSNPQTKLEAVNAMLIAIGAAPVNSLAPAFSDQNLAVKLLEDVVREVCQHGFKFNTDTNYKLQPDIDGYIHVPVGALNVDPTDPHQDLIQRYHPDLKQELLWDQTNHTFEIGEDVRVNVRWAYDFDALPASAKSYVTAAASRRFQAQVIGDPTADRLSDDQEQRAWLVLIKEQHGNANPNYFRQNPKLNASRNRYWR
ncbi:hypothetical protein WEU32_06905 [Brevundimonas sp. BH3]|uniref:hypothetical protein n=1 Tax=Brevundimonas sp. BH3 TaxID=3133089 RepID=UPI00324695B0